VSLDTLKEALVHALEARRFDVEALRAAAREYGSRSTESVVDEAVETVGVPA